MTNWSKIRLSREPDLVTRDGRRLYTFRSLSEMFSRDDPDGFLTNMVRALMKGAFGNEVSVLELRIDVYHEDRYSVRVPVAGENGEVRWNPGLLPQVLAAGGLLKVAKVGLEDLSIHDYKQQFREKLLDMAALEEQEIPPYLRKLPISHTKRLLAPRRTHDDALSAALREAFLDLLRAGREPGNKQVLEHLRRQILTRTNSPNSTYLSIISVECGPTLDTQSVTWLAADDREKTTAGKAIQKRMTRIGKSSQR